MIKGAIANLVSGRSLTVAEAASAMEEIMDGQATPAQISAFITAIRMKGETVDELVGLAKTMRSKAIPVHYADEVIDTCGTGGDELDTFNISTATAIVAAGAGLRVAKHGNRAMSSQCGSADVLETLGVRIDLTAEKVERCLKEIGIGFMFAQVFHPAFKHAAVPRREIGIRTVFNILGPLTSPVGAKAQVIGVANAALVEKMALALKSLGCKHGMVVHGKDGLAEITITCKTMVCEIEGNMVKDYTISPEDFGLLRADIGSIKGGTLEENADILRSILAGVTGPHRDVVLMNAAAAIVTGDKAKTLQQGVELAKETIDSGHAQTKLEQWIELSQKLAGG
jgi:anthranilate phosphoribosyltransferase